ncbi:MAG: hypothetical protein ACRD6R_02410 [Candidatus Polarisedimenticolia bacterium]
MGAVILAGLLAASFAGCDDSDLGLSGLGSPTLSGTGRSAPQIAGAWAYEAAATANTCGAASFLFDEEGKLDLVLSDTKIVFAISGACDAPLAEGEGTALHDATVVLEYGRTVAVSERCLLSLKAEITGTVNALRTGISGMHAVAISGKGDCGGGLPCRISGAFTATRCPAGGCEPQECEPPGAE